MVPLSLHGWHHVYRVRKWYSRASWLSIVIASLSVASVFLTIALKDFTTKAVVTTIETTTASLQVRTIEISRVGNFLRGNDKQTVVRSIKPIQLKSFIYVLFSVTHFLLYNKMVQNCRFFSCLHISV